MIQKLLALAAAAAFLAAAAVHAQPAPPPTGPTPPPEPFLRIAAEAHTQVVNRMAFGGGGRIVATVSDDKTVRIWQAATGEALATLRVPIGPGDEGALYAVAISPDSKTLLAAGWTGEAWDKAFCVYVFDLAEQRLKGRLPGLPGPVNHLAFSPDGSKFAIAMGGGGGVRLVDATTGAVVRADQDGWNERATWVAFDRAGRYAATGFDGEVRLYDANGNRIARRLPGVRGRAYSLAFSPAGDVLAVGYADAARVELLSARDLAPRSTLRTPESGNLAAVAWAPDGRLMAAGSVRDATGAVIVRTWTAGGRTRGPDWPASRDTVFEIEGAPDGGVFVASADPAFTRLAPTGGVTFRNASPGLDFRDLGDQQFTLSEDGTVVELRARGMTQAWRVDMAQRQVGEAPVRRALTAVPAAAVTNPVQVGNWRNTASPTIDGRPVKLDPQEQSRSWAATPDQRMVVLGTDYALKVVMRDGQKASSAPLPAAAWAIRVSGDGRTVVAAVGDGTLRWFGIDGDGTLSERIALYLAGDGRRWVAWTPSGLFDHADQGGKELVGVQLNRGRGQPPDWFSFAQVYRLMYAPDAVSRRLRGEAEGPGIDLASISNELRGVQGGRSSPPEIELVSVCWQQGGEACRPLVQTAVSRGIRRQDGPSDPGVDLVLPPGVTNATIRYRLLEKDAGPGPVDVFVNGRNAGRAQPTRGVRRDTALEASFPVEAGPNQVYLRAYNSERLIYAQSRVVRVQLEAPKPVATPVPDAGKADEGQPRLYVLAVGVDKYRGGGIDPLNFAVADARAVADKLRANVPASYGRADVTGLFDADATADRVEQALQRIAAAARVEDTVLVYLSGHGINIGGTYYFVTQNVTSAQTIPGTALSGTRLVQALAAIKAKNAMLFLDTCYAGSFSLGGRELDATSQLSHESGRYVLAGAASREEALDAYDDHNGVFATAVLRGLSGNAAPGQGQVNNFALGLYVAPLVRELAKEKNHSQNARFKIAAEDAQPFPIVQVKGR